MRRLHGLGFRSKLSTFEMPSSPEMHYNAHVWQKGREGSGGSWDGDDPVTCLLGAWGRCCQRSTKERPDFRVLGDMHDVNREAASKVAGS